MSENDILELEVRVRNSLKKKGIEFNKEQFEEYINIFIREKIQT